jgi:hypothetical protein
MQEHDEIVLDSQPDLAKPIPDLDTVKDIPEEHRTSIQELIDLHLDFCTIGKVKEEVYDKYKQEHLIPFLEVKKAQHEIASILAETLAKDAPDFFQMDGIMIYVEKRIEMVPPNGEQKAMGLVGIVEQMFPGSAEKIKERFREWIKEHTIPVARKILKVFPPD